MARMARAVALGYPHHVTQRGNRRQQTLFNDEDYQAYLELMTQLLKKHERTGRPLGEDVFVEGLEALLDRKLKPRKPTPKQKDK